MSHLLAVSRKEKKGHKSDKLHNANRDPRLGDDGLSSVEVRNIYSHARQALKEDGQSSHSASQKFHAVLHGVHQVVKKRNMVEDWSKAIMEIKLEKLRNWEFEKSMIESEEGWPNIVKELISVLDSIFGPEETEHQKAERDEIIENIIKNVQFAEETLADLLSRLEESRRDALSIRDEIEQNSALFDDIAERIQSEMEEVRRMLDRVMPALPPTVIEQIMEVSGSKFLEQLKGEYIELKRQAEVAYQEQMEEATRDQSKWSYKGTDKSSQRLSSGEYLPDIVDVPEDEREGLQDSELIAEILSREGRKGPELIAGGDGMTDDETSRRSMNLQEKSDRASYDGLKCKDAQQNGQPNLDVGEHRRIGMGNTSGTDPNVDVGDVDEQIHIGTMFDASLNTMFGQINIDGIDTGNISGTSSCKESITSGAVLDEQQNFTRTRTNALPKGLHVPGVATESMTNDVANNEQLNLSSAVSNSSSSKLNKSKKVRKKSTLDGQRKSLGEVPDAASTPSQGSEDGHGDTANAAHALLAESSTNNMMTIQHPLIENFKFGRHEQNEFTREGSFKGPALSFGKVHDGTKLGLGQVEAYTSNPLVKEEWQWPRDNCADEYDDEADSGYRWPWPSGRIDDLVTISVLQPTNRSVINTLLSEQEKPKFHQNYIRNDLASEPLTQFQSSIKRDGKNKFQRRNSLHEEFSKIPGKLRGSRSRGQSLSSMNVYSRMTPFGASKIPTKLGRRVRDGIASVASKFQLRQTKVLGFETSPAYNVRGAKSRDSRFFEPTDRIEFDAW